MKRIVALLFILFVANQSGSAQSTPYTGGDGSGYLSQNSPAVICSNFFGGIADGADAALSQVTICPPFFGGIADGSAAALSQATVCPPFFGGIADGYSGSNKAGCNVVVAAKPIIFYGEKEPFRNVLHWKVSGFDVSMFEVQKSSTGNGFTTFGTVAGSTGNNINYLFIDDAPFANVTYYRLRIIERNSLITYSDIVPLRNTSTSEPIIYPNPSQGFSMLDYYAERPQTIMLSVFQADGKKILAKTISLKGGKNNILLDLQSLPDGIYFVRIGESEKVFKLIISR